MTVVYTLVAMIAYVVTTLVVNTQILSGSDVSWIDFEALVTRLIGMAAVGGLASFFWWVQRNRRRAATS
jgi:hypothetical protein